MCLKQNTSDYNQMFPFKSIDHYKKGEEDVSTIPPPGFAILNCIFPMTVEPMKLSTYDFVSKLK